MKFFSCTFGAFSFTIFIENFRAFGANPPSSFRGVIEVKIFSYAFGTFSFTIFIENFRAFGANPPSSYYLSSNSLEYITLIVVEHKISRDLSPASLSLV